MPASLSAVPRNPNQRLIESRSDTKAADKMSTSELLNTPDSPWQLFLDSDRSSSAVQRLIQLARTLYPEVFDDRTRSDAVGTGSGAPPELEFAW